MKRKKEVDRAMKELETTKEENQEIKKKLDGARCRIRNLECDATTIRQKMQTFIEKSNHDDLLINEQRVSSITIFKTFTIVSFRFFFITGTRLRGDRSSK